MTGDIAGDEVTTVKGKLAPGLLPLERRTDCQCEAELVPPSHAPAAGPLFRSGHAHQIHSDGFCGIIGRDSAMLEVVDFIRALEDTDVPVLIYGESGAGKELVASAIHNHSRQSNGRFVPVNCGAFPESLLESELFGYVKGAFTGATRNRKGRFALAHNGTIFLDEIGDMSPAMQVTLLRVLQDGTFECLGGERTDKVNARVISATNKDLSEEIDSGRFRRDLYYRLSVVPLTVPPLRERRTDIPLLADHILRKALDHMGREAVVISDEALDVMRSHEWPGNVRELQNWIHFSLVKCKGPAILPKHLPPCRHADKPSSTHRRFRRRVLEAGAVRIALEATQGNKLEAARRLGVSRATLYRFLENV